jgi:hypothetical protein
MNVRRDMFVILAITFAAYFIFFRFDALERIVRFTSTHESLELDELISASIVFSVCMGIAAFRWWREMKLINDQLSRKNRRIEKAMNAIRVLRGILPTCSYCKKIKNEDGSWMQMESYIDNHSEAQFSHGICPDCYEKIKDLGAFSPPAD